METVNICIRILYELLFSKVFALTLQLSSIALKV